MNTCDAKNLLTDIFYHVFISIGEGEGWEGLGGLVWVWGRGGGGSIIGALCLFLYYFQYSRLFCVTYEKCFIIEDGFDWISVILTFPFSF